MAREDGYLLRFDTRASEWEGDLTAWIQQNAPDNEMQRQRVLRNLHRAVEKELTLRQREVVQRYFFQGETIPQIAEELGVNRSTVSRTLRRGKARIFRCLQYSF